ncbi:MAG: hypothetical protein V1822_04620 [Candidatus Micrarchaeota archaeon]
MGKIGADEPPKPASFMGHDGGALGREAAGGRQEGAGEEPEQPQVPKALMDRGQSEGPLRSIGLKSVCKICGAQNSVHANRCVRCGFKFSSKK